MADDLAHIVAINTAVHSYTNNCDSYNAANPAISGSVSTYNPLNEFNTLLSNSGIASSTVTTCRVTWDATTKVCTIQFGGFKNKLNSTIFPHQQESHITE